jgi:2-polyprenyl-3-methyl-5-hydroxy-6-metoxy-1,4-benzoquinol methylase
MPDDSSTRSWNAAADDWVAHADENDYRNFFLMPLMLRMLGEVSGRTILDLGCGEGGYSRELARRGARVTGVDGSERLIEVARERAGAEHLDIEFIAANASAIGDDVGDESFDVVMAAMSLMDVENYPGAVREVHRVLVSGGELLMSITHPCFTAPVSHWVRDDEGGLEVFAVDRYFDRDAWDDQITGRFRTPVIRRHRPLEDYLGALLEAGFVLREFREPSAARDDIAKSARFQKLTRIPYFLFMRWLKLPLDHRQEQHSREPGAE